MKTQKKRNISAVDILSIVIIIVCITFVVYILIVYPPTEKAPIYSVVGVVGSVASSGGLLIAIIQIIALKKTSEATKLAIVKTEKELSLMRSIESASNCFNQVNQIDEYLETMNIDSIKTLLPFATQNFHEMIHYKDYELDDLMKLKKEISNFLEDFAGQLTILANHKNTRQEPFHFTDDELSLISRGLQKTKAFANEYRTLIEQEIIKD